jgi:hypothetical protein
LPTTEPITTSLAGDVSIPAVLVGEWSGSSHDGQVGTLELVLNADGEFHWYGDNSMDWRGKATVQGSQIVFHFPDGTVDTHDWSVSGGTLTLAGNTYLKKTPGAGGQLALAGEWMGEDDIFERLVFGEDGTFERRHDAEGIIRGTFQVQADTLTLTLQTGETVTLHWSVANGILTLQGDTGEQAQYARAS